MADRTKILSIDSILGGISPNENFAGEDQFQFSYGIDPDTAGTYGSSGYVIPTFVASTASFAAAPLWMETEPKISTSLFVYDYAGSVYTVDSTGTITGLTDLNDGGTAKGNGLAYYDNYMYASRSTTVARYGPLNGTPAWTDDYWSTTLGKTALADTTYPRSGIELSFPNQPNHPLLRHNNGKLYIADVVGNQGVLHCISTSKTTVEGDTDSGSTYNAIDFPYGMYPTALASYGDLIAVALYEGSTPAPSTRGKRAKVAFWDPTNPNTYDLLFSEEFPDSLITGLINANGVLYAISGEVDQLGFRVTRYAGGRTFEQVSYIEYGILPVQGALDTDLNQLFIGSGTSQNRGAVFRVGSKLSPVSNNVFNIIGGSSTASMGQVSALKLAFNTQLGVRRPCVGAFGTGSPFNYFWRPSDGTGGEVTSARIIFRPVRTGSPGKIKKLTLNLTGSLTGGSTQTIVPSFLNTNNATLMTINYTSVGDKTHIVIRPEACTFQSEFSLQLDFGGVLTAEESVVGVKLPILIEYEPLDD